jgi:hypothetical protein
MKTVLVAVATLSGLSPLAFAAEPTQVAPPPPPPCRASDGYICNQQGPEDLVALNADWAVVSAYEGTGGVALIRIKDRTTITAYPSPTAKDKQDTKTYPDCPGPPRGLFRTHGVYVPPRRGSKHQIFAVGHGARESIEVFDVDTSGAAPVLTWTGCVIAPEPIGLNSVRGLPDGGFVTTNWLPRGGPREAMQRMMGGERNGELWEWHTKSGWQKVPGSETSGANGVELSDDGKTIYMASWGSRSFIRLSRGASPPKRDEIKLGFQIDNIHWAKDGQLLGAGQVGQDWRVVKIDPKTLEVRQIYAQDDKPGFGGGTVALEVDDTLWIGSYRGDRIAIVPVRGKPDLAGSAGSR